VALADRREWRIRNNHFRFCILFAISSSLAVPPSFAHWKEQQHLSSKTSYTRWCSNNTGVSFDQTILSRRSSKNSIQDFLGSRLRSRPAHRDDPLECGKRGNRTAVSIETTRIETLWDSLGATETRSSPFMDILRECDIVFDTLSHAQCCCASPGVWSRAIHSSLVPRTWPGCVTFDAGRPSGIN